MFYRNYINDIEERLLLERKELEEAYKEAIAKVENDEHEDSVNAAFEDLWEENFEFTPSLLYSSIFLSLYGYFEGTLKNCYEDCITSWGFGYPPIGKTKKTINDYKGFFNKHKLYAFDKKDFKFIDDCTIIRDKLIHTNGEMTEDEITSFRSIVSKYPSIHIRTNRFSITDKNLTLELNSVVKNILEDMCTHLYKNIVEYSN